MKVVVCGSRGWEDVARMREVLSLLPEDAIIVHGGARGADRMADSLWRKCGDTIPIVYPAKWAEHGKAAGMLRNLQMLNEEDPDLVVAFWDGSSRGTKGMMDMALRRGVELWEIRA